MQKIASTAQLAPTDLQKIAAFGFGVALASPVIGGHPEQVKRAADAFMGAMQKSAARHLKVVDMLRKHVQGPARA